LDGAPSRPSRPSAGPWPSDRCRKPSLEHNLPVSSGHIGRRAGRSPAESTSSSLRGQPKIGKGRNAAPGEVRHEGHCEAGGVEMQGVVGILWRYGSPLAEGIGSCTTSAARAAYKWATAY